MKRPLPTIVLLLAAGLIFVLHTAYYWPWQEDDAFISFHYAQNLVQGQGPVFNPGERVEGYSNPLWVLLAAGALKLGLDPLPAARVLGLLAGLACLFLAWRLAQRLLREGGAATDSLAALLAPFFLALSPVLARHAVTGLETVPYAALLTALAGGFGAGSGAAPRGRLNFGLPCGLLLLALLRPEGAAFALLILGWRLWAARGIGTGAVTRAWAETALFGVLLAAFLAWRWSYYGQLLPNTFHTKLTGETVDLRDGLHYGLDFLRENGGAVTAGLFAAVLLGRRIPRLYWVLVSVVALQAAFVTAAGGDWMHFYRFYAPVLPLLAAGLAAGWGTLTGLCGSKEIGRHWTPRNWARRLVPAVVVLVAVLGMIKTERTALRLVMPDVRGGTYLTDGYREAARWIAGNTPPSASLAVSDIGILGYESGRRIIDMFGLVDPHIARRPGRLHYKSDARYVLENRPDLVVLVVGADGTYLRVPDQALAAEPDFQTGYRLVHTVDIGFRTETIQIFARTDAPAP